MGGVSIQAVLLTRELVDLGYLTRLVAGLCEEDEGDMSYLLNTGESVIWVPGLSRSIAPFSNCLALVRLWRVLRSERPDVVHTHTAMAGCLGRVAAVLAGVPIIIHTFHGNSLSGYFTPFLASVFKLIERFLAKYTDAICVICEQQLEELSGTFNIAPKDRFHVVPLGLDLSPFERLSFPDAAGGPLRVGWFGRLVPVKDIPLLIRIIETTLERTGSVEFHIAGDGSERELVMAAARRFGSHLIWHGWQKDIAPIIGRCHVLLQTSLNEGTPVALIQGMAAARPFLSTAVGGLVDMVAGPVVRTSHGCSWYSNGILADPDPSAFANALLALSHDRSQLRLMGQQARVFASEKFSKHALLKGLDSLYRQLLSQKLHTVPPNREVAVSAQ